MIVLKTESNFDRNRGRQLSSEGVRSCLSQSPENRMSTESRDNFIVLNNRRQLRDLNEINKKGHVRRNTEISSHLRSEESLETPIRRVDKGP
jgi:hypothetical protein